MRELLLAWAQGHPPLLPTHGLIAGGGGLRASGNGAPRHPKCSNNLVVPMNTSSSLPGSPVTLILDPNRGH